MAFDKQVSSITLTGSVLSSVASACVLACFIIFRKNQQTFRHALVFNLTLSDFINATVNVISGSIYIRNHELVDSPACTFNGWIEQLSVQATDFSILAISVATLLVVTQKARLASVSTKTCVLICLSVWVMPLITSTTVTAMGEMKPVSGNWCWISKERTDLRYGATHGWRFAIIGITIGIYTYVWWYLSQHFKAMRGLAVSSVRSRKASKAYVEIGADKGQEDQIALNKVQPTTSSVNDKSHFDVEAHSSQPREQSGEGSWPASTRGDSTIDSDSMPNPANEYMRERSKQAYKDIKRMLLLNGYPLLYVILWIPGIINRVMEATGSNNSRVLAILQCSTQFIGFANAITYGMNQQWRGR